MHTTFLMTRSIKKNLDPNKIKIDKKSYRNVIIYYIQYVTIKNLSYVKINNVIPLYPIINKASGQVDTLKKAMNINM